MRLQIFGHDIICQDVRVTDAREDVLLEAARLRGLVEDLTRQVAALALAAHPAEPEQAENVLAGAPPAPVELGMHGVPPAPPLAPPPPEDEPETESEPEVAAVPPPPPRRPVVPPPPRPAVPPPPLPTAEHEFEMIPPMPARPPPQ